jgi:hypothetical protein
MTEKAATAITAIDRISKFWTTRLVATRVNEQGWFVTTLSTRVGSVGQIGGGRGGRPRGADAGYRSDLIQFAEQPFGSWFMPRA